VTATYFLVGGREKVPRNGNDQDLDVPEESSGKGEEMRAGTGTCRRGGRKKSVVSPHAIGARTMARCGLDRVGGRGGKSPLLLGTSALLVDHRSRSSLL